MTLAQWEQEYGVGVPWYPNVRRRYVHIFDLPADPSSLANLGSLDDWEVCVLFSGSMWLRPKRQMEDTHAL